MKLFALCGLAVALLFVAPNLAEARDAGPRPRAAVARHPRAGRVPYPTRVARRHHPRNHGAPHRFAPPVAYRAPVRVVPSHHRFAPARHHAMARR